MSRESSTFLYVLSSAGNVEPQPDEIQRADAGVGGETEEEQLIGSPIHHIDGWVAPALIVSVDEDPAVVGSHGHIVSETAKHYVSALSEKGHVGQAFHDITEDHASLAMGFGMDGDAVTETVEAFLNGLP